jgi:outer membrane protein assembly factor BamE (lipoprotein component of BamABCDE complex)
MDRAAAVAMAMLAKRCGVDVDRRRRPVQLSRDDQGRYSPLRKPPLATAMIQSPRIPIPLRLSRSRSIAVAMIAISVVATGCTPIVANRGNMLEEERIAQVKNGTSSKNDVFEALGSPSIVSTFDDNTWYYVGQRTERESFFKPEVTERKVIAVEFDDTDHVKAVDRIGLDQAVDVEPLEETTPAVGREITFMEQLIGNIGRPSSKHKKKSDDDSGG